MNLSALINLEIFNSPFFTHVGPVSGSKYSRPLQILIVFIVFIFLLLLLLLLLLSLLLLLLLSFDLLCDYDNLYNK